MNKSFTLQILLKKSKKALYLSVNVFSKKVLIGDTTGPPFYVFIQGLAFCRAKQVPSFLSYFKTLSIGQAPGIEPATSRSAVKRTTHWANPAAVK